MATEISNFEDVIDSRDIIERIEEIEEELNDDDNLDENEISELKNELAALAKVADEGVQNLVDWKDGETLIRETYFTQYAEELASDIGAINTDAGWPLSYIDWDAAADALKMDYTEIDFNGVTYLARS